MRDALILLVYCFLCYPKLLGQQPPSGIEGVVAGCHTLARLNPVPGRLVLRSRGAFTKAGR
jgi:hypothetical protein